MPVQLIESPVIQGRGVSLRPIIPETDAEELHEVFGDAEQLRFMTRPSCADVKATEALLREWDEDDASPQWVVTEERTVGRVTLVHLRTGVYEAGIQVLPRAQGRGVATRAIILVTKFAFDHLRACRVFGDIDPDNVPCRRAFIRARFRFEGTLRANWKTDRGVFDSDIYAATGEWEPPA